MRYTAEIIRELYIKSMSDGDRTTWIENGNECYDFYLNRQLTDDEILELEEMEFPTFIINEMTSHIEMMIFLLVGNSPSFKAVGRHGFDTMKADVHDTVARTDWKFSNGQTKMFLGVRDTLLRGMGGVGWEIVTDPQSAQKRLKLTYYNTKFMHFGAVMNDPFGRDLPWFMYKKDTPRSQLIADYPQYKAKIKKATAWADSEYGEASGDTFEETMAVEIEGDYKTPIDRATGDYEDVLDNYILHYRESTEFVRIEMKVISEPSLVEEKQKKIKTEFMLAKQEIKVRVEETKLQLKEAYENGQMIESRYKYELAVLEKEASEKTLELNAQMQSAMTSVEMTTRPFHLKKSDYKKSNIKPDSIIGEPKEYLRDVIHKVFVIGDQLIYDKELPFIHQYPILFLPYIFLSSPHGVPYGLQMLGKQRELNKLHQIVVNHASNSSSLRFLAPDSMIADKETFEKSIARPMSVTTFEDDGQGGKPTALQPAPLNNAFYGLVSERRNDMNNLAGLSSVTHGDAGGVEGYRALLAMDENSTRRVKSFSISFLEEWLNELGRVHKQMAQGLYTSQRVFRVSSPLADGSIEEFQAEINIPLYDDDGKEIGLYNDYASWEFDVEFVAGSTAPLNRFAKQELAVTLFEKGLYDDIEAIKYTEARDKKALIKRKSQLSQAHGKIEQQDEKIKQQKDQLDTERRARIQAEAGKEKAEATNELAQVTADTKAQNHITRESLKKEMQMVLKEFVINLEAISKEQKDKKELDNKKK